MSDLEFITRSRGYIRAKTTKLCDKIDESLNVMSRSDKLSSISKLESLDQELKRCDKEINASIWKVAKDEQKLTEEMAACDAYSHRIVEGLVALRESFTPDPIASIASSSVSVPPQRINKLKLPEIPLPFFSNSKGETLSNFLINFDNIIGKYELSNFEKFVFLKKQLKGEPLVLVNSLSGNNQSYPEARKLLEEAFARTVSQQFDVIARLSSLKLANDSSPYEFVSEMRSVINLLQTLSVDVDTITQYFVWNGMTECLQNQLVHICNSNKPNLKQINDNIFEALDRYNEIIGKKNTKKDYVVKAKSSLQELPTVSTFATNVNYDKNSNKRIPFCSLCSERNGPKNTSHSTRDCPNYRSAESKLERLKSLNACIRCGYVNHKTTDCSFKFSKPCLNCNGKHMSFLCASSKKNPNFEKINKNSGANVTSGMICAEAAFHSNVGSETLLPTFSLSIDGLKLRGMKDTGCQPNFILSSVATELNLPVVKNNFQVTVNGFNQSKKYETKIVSVNLKIGNDFHNVEAICIPNIPTSLNCPGLKGLANEFVSKGYLLADNALRHSDKINNLSFILSTREASQFWHWHAFSLLRNRSWGYDFW